jgi:hypothetical protein
LELGASLTGSCGLGTGGLGVSIGSWGLGKVVAVSRTPGPGLVGMFSAGASLSDTASHSKGGDERAEDGGKGGYSGT